MSCTRFIQLKRCKSKEIIGTALPIENSGGSYVQRRLGLFPISVTLMFTYFLNWSKVALQCCVSFCCLTAWITYMNTYLPPFWASITSPYWNSWIFKRRPPKVPILILPMALMQYGMRYGVYSTHTLYPGGFVSLARSPLLAENDMWVVTQPLSPYYVW